MMTMRRLMTWIGGLPVAVLVDALVRPMESVSDSLDASLGDLLGRKHGLDLVGLAAIAHVRRIDDARLPGMALLLAQPALRVGAQ